MLYIFTTNGSNLSCLHHYILYCWLLGRRALEGPYSSCVHQKQAFQDNRICQCLNASKEHNYKCYGLKVYPVVEICFLIVF